jgi:hypothetical protein
MIKKIDNYEHYYVSDDGKVYSTSSGELKELKLIFNQGYMYVSLSKNSKHTYYRVHRLVGNAFVDNPNPEKYTIINHKDGNKINNHASNLEWTNMSENTKHAYLNGLAKNAKGEEDSQSNPIDVYNAENIFIKHYGSICECERDLNISRSTLLRLAKRGTLSRKYKIFVRYSKKCND